MKDHSSDEDEPFSLTIQDPGQENRKGYFVSRGKLIVCVVIVVCLLIVVAVLTATFSWFAGKSSHQQGKVDLKILEVFINAVRLII